MQTHEVTKLLRRFSLIWTDKWDKKFKEDAEAITAEWHDALKKISWQDAEVALSRVRANSKWPPTIAEFLGALPKQKIIPEWTHADSVEIAAEKIRRVIPKNFAEHCLLIQEILPELEKRIFETKSKEIDFSICVVRDCVGFHIHNTARPLTWYCEQHSMLEHS